MTFLRCCTLLVIQRSLQFQEIQYTLGMESLIQEGNRASLPRQKELALKWNFISLCFWDLTSALKNCLHWLLTETFLVHMPANDFFVCVLEKSEVFFVLVLLEVCKIADAACSCSRL